jgi:hypothetical protein
MLWRSIHQCVSPSSRHPLADRTELDRLYSRDEKNPENRKEWRTQHDALKFIDPPFVYHIVSLPPSPDQTPSTDLQHEKSEAELDAAIRAILKNPIDRYIRKSGWCPMGSTTDAVSGANDARVGSFQACRHD